VALETMVDRLAADHANAKRLAAGVANTVGLSLAQDTVETNIVLFDLSPSLSVSDFTMALEAHGVKVGSRGGNLFRAVTHRMVNSGDIDEALGHMAAVCKQLLGRTRR